MNGITKDLKVTIFTILGFSPLGPVLYGPFAKGRQIVLMALQIAYYYDSMITSEGTT